MIARFRGTTDSEAETSAEAGSSGEESGTGRGQPPAPSAGQEGGRRPQPQGSPNGPRPFRIQAEGRDHPGESLPHSRGPDIKELILTFSTFTSVSIAQDETPRDVSLTRGNFRNS